MENQWGRRRIKRMPRWTGEACGGKGKGFKMPPGLLVQVTERRVAAFPKAGNSRRTGGLPGMSLGG